MLSFGCLTKHPVCEFVVQCQLFSISLLFSDFHMPLYINSGGNYVNKAEARKWHFSSPVYLPEYLRKNIKKVESIVTCSIYDML